MFDTITFNVTDIFILLFLLFFLGLFVGFFCLFFLTGFKTSIKNPGNLKLSNLKKSSKIIFISGITISFGLIVLSCHLCLNGCKQGFYLIFIALLLLLGYIPLLINFTELTKNDRKE